VKRSGRDEPVWVSIHMCMEAMLGISLYSYLYLKIAKCYVILAISYIFSSTKSVNKRTEQVLPGSRVVGKGRKGRGAAHTMYTHVSKCKDNTIK
jgi:hypothetical protein